VCQAWWRKAQSLIEMFEIAVYLRILSSQDSEKWSSTAGFQSLKFKEVFRIYTYYQESLSVSRLVSGNVNGEELG
jgi:hypothetical protein